MASSGPFWVALQEGRCQIRSGTLPRVMSVTGNLAVSILRQLRVKNIRRTMDQLPMKEGACGAMAVVLD